MDQVVSVVAIVPQFSRNDLVGRETAGIGNRLQRIGRRAQKPSLAEKILSQIAGIVQNRGNRQEYPAVGGIFPDALAGGNDGRAAGVMGEKFPMELAGGNLVTVGDDAIRLFMDINVCAGKSHKEEVRFFQRFAELFPGGFRLLQRFGAARHGKGSVMDPGMPQAAVFEKVAFRVFRLQSAQRLLNGERIVRDPVGIAQTPDSSGVEQGAEYSIGKAGTRGAASLFEPDAGKGQFERDFGTFEWGRRHRHIPASLFSLSRRREYRGSRTAFRTAMDTAFREPTRTMSFFARVIPV